MKCKKKMVCQNILPISFNSVNWRGGGGGENLKRNSLVKSLVSHFMFSPPEQLHINVHLCPFSAWRLNERLQASAL